MACVTVIPKISCALNIALNSRDGELNSSARGIPSKFIRYLPFHRPQTLRMRSLHVHADFQFRRFHPAIGCPLTSNVHAKTRTLLFPRNAGESANTTENTSLPYFIQFFVATILTEHLVSDFWLPLEEDTMHLLPKIAEIEAELLKQGGFECETITEFLKQEQTQIAASYILSLYFLLSVMHATRVVDIRLLR